MVDVRHGMAWSKTKTMGREVKLNGILRATGERVCTVGGAARLRAEDGRRRWVSPVVRIVAVGVDGLARRSAFCVLNKRSLNGNDL